MLQGSALRFGVWGLKVSVLARVQGIGSYVWDI